MVRFGSGHFYCITLWNEKHRILCGSWWHYMYSWVIMRALFVMYRSNPKEHLHSESRERLHGWTWRKKLPLLRTLSLARWVSECVIQIQSLIGCKHGLITQFCLLAGCIGFVRLEQTWSLFIAHWSSELLFSPRAIMADSFELSEIPNSICCLGFSWESE